MMQTTTQERDMYIEFLKQAREEKGYTSIVKFANASGIAATAIDSIFKNKSFLKMNVATLIAFCRALEISPNFILMDGNGNFTDTAPQITSEVQSPDKAKEKELLLREMALVALEEALLQKKKALVTHQLNSL